MRLLLARLLLALALMLAGCTDAARSSIAAYGRTASIKCYSGGQLVYDGKSSGRINTVTNSDGWEFEEAETGVFVRVSGTCVIRN